MASATHQTPFVSQHSTTGAAGWWSCMSSFNGELKQEGGETRTFGNERMTTHGIVLCVVGLEMRLSSV